MAIFHSFFVCLPEGIWNLGAQMGTLSLTKHQDLRFDAVYFSGSLTVSSTDPFTCDEFPMFNGFALMDSCCTISLDSTWFQRKRHEKVWESMRKYEKVGVQMGAKWEMFASCNSWWSSLLDGTVRWCQIPQVRWKQAEIFQHGDGNLTDLGASSMLHMTCYSAHCPLDVSRHV
jgi:hypothetical protein